MEVKIMGAIVKVNGKERPNVLFIVDTWNRTARLETPKVSEIKIDLEKYNVEVNIYGERFE